MTTSHERPLRIVIADHHPSIRENLRYLLDAETDLEVVGVAKDGVGALQLALGSHPDVLVLDYELPTTTDFPSRARCEMRATGRG